MNQPPSNTARPSTPPPAWCRPPGVAAGTWDYVHQGAIADRYDQFVADVAMQDVELQILDDCFPPLENPNSATVIDLGCGTGRTAIPLSGKGYDVIAVDLSQPMLENLIRKTQSHNQSGQPSLLGTIHPLRANLVQLDGLADDSADHAACLFSTLGMIAGRNHRQTMLRHVRRIVRPGGTFLIHVHHRWAGLREPNGWQTTARSLCKSLVQSDHQFGDSVYAYRGIGQMFMHRFGRRELHRDLQSTGWRVRRHVRLSIDGRSIGRRFPICGGFFVVAS